MLVFWWEEVTGLCEVVCFGVSGGSLSADDWVCVLTWLLIWVRYPALGAPGSWEVLGLESVFLSGGQGLLPVLSCSLQDLLHLKMYS